MTLNHGAASRAQPLRSSVLSVRHGSESLPHPGVVVAGDGIQEGGAAGAGRLLGPRGVDDLTDAERRVASAHVVAAGEIHVTPTAYVTLIRTRRRLAASVAFPQAGRPERLQQLA